MPQTVQCDKVIISIIKRMAATRTDIEKYSLTFTAPATTNNIEKETSKLPELAAVEETMKTTMKTMTQTKGL